jgi:hypothetical protein
VSQLQGRRRKRGVALILLGCGAPHLACFPSRVSLPPSTTEADWQEAHARLALLRASAPEHAYGIVIRVSLRARKSGQVFVARGALAVDPHRALRMILLGPGGGTALDAWVTPAAYRLELPALGVLRRGGVSPEPGLPIDFFRWWFLSPLDGRLLASSPRSGRVEEGGRRVEEGGREEVSSKGGRWFILRRGAATVILEDAERPGGLEIVATERRPGALEHLAFQGLALAPHSGDRTEYEEARTGVRAEVVVESVDATEPEPVAFLDPDHGGER